MDGCFNTVIAGEEALFKLTGVYLGMPREMARHLVLQTVIDGAGICSAALRVGGCHAAQTYYHLGTLTGGM